MSLVLLIKQVLSKKEEKVYHIVYLHIFFHLLSLILTEFYSVKIFERERFQLANFHIRRMFIPPTQISNKTA